jgi:hypothetical protein
MNRICEIVVIPDVIADADTLAAASGIRRGIEP